MSRTIFYGPKDVRAIEVRLYSRKYIIKHYIRKNITLSDFLIFLVTIFYLTLQLGTRSLGSPDKDTFLWGHQTKIHFYGVTRQRYIFMGSPDKVTFLWGHQTRLHFCRVTRQAYIFIGSPDKDTFLWGHQTRLHFYGVTR